MFDSSIPPLDFSLVRLGAAWEQVRTRSQAAGVDGITPELFAGVLGEELHLLQRQLRRETYTAQPAKGFHLKKKSGGFRLIGIPTVRDRAVVVEIIYSYGKRALLLDEILQGEPFAAQSQGLYHPGAGELEVQLIDPQFN